jgi:hypothetical protein
MRKDSTPRKESALSDFGNTSNPHLGLSPRLKHLTPKALYLALAVLIAVVIIWFATRTGAMKKAADLGLSVGHHPSSLLSGGTKPKPPAGKPLLPPTAPAPLPPLPNWSNLQAASASPTSPTQAAPGPATTAVAPAPIPGAASPSPVSAARPAYAPLSYNARHDKAFGGSCSGQLVLSSGGLQFNCPNDSHGSVQIAISEISSVDENGVRLTSGKKLHFTIAGMTKPNEQALFTDWFNRLR